MRIPPCRALGLARAVALAAAPVAAAPAAAQDRPPFPPARDAAVTYRVWDGRGRPGEARVAWSAALRALRAEAAGPAAATTAPGGVPLPPGARLVVDLRAGRAFAAEDRSGLVLELPRLAAAARRGERALAGARVRRLGADRVAGQPCTAWRVEPADGGRGRPVHACLTADGVPLRLREEGGAARAEAVAVAYGPLDPALFAPPRGGVAGGAGGALGRALGGLLGGGAAGPGGALRGLLGPGP